MSTFLVLYESRSWPLRTTVDDHLFALRRHGTVRTIYVNVAVPGAGAVLRAVKADVIVFHTILLAARWNPRWMQRLEHRLEPLRSSKAVKVALPQDEFVHTDYLCDFINRFGIDHVFSVASEDEWDAIYGRCSPRPTLSRVLTGYLDETTIARSASIAARTPRTIDIGYRAWHAEPWLGSFAQLKISVGTAVEAAAQVNGYTTDISTRAGDTLLGDQWLQFLASCRYTVGVEGGASIRDRDGSLMVATRGYMATHPNATFAEVEGACFPGRDGESKLRAISPRHLEAVATKTGQVLIEGDYNGVLIPRLHYIPLRPDFSNLCEVLDKLGDEDARLRMVERAYVDIILSGKYLTRHLAAALVEGALAHRGDAPNIKNGRIIYWIAGVFEVASWAWVRGRMVAKHVLVDPARRFRSALRKRWRMPSGLL